MSGWHITPLTGSLGPHAPAWDRLNARLMGSHPLLDSGFMDALLQHFGSGQERLLWCERQGQVVAMCILSAQTAGCWRSFLPPQQQLGPTLISELSLLDEIWSVLPWRVLQLDLLCNDPAFGPVVASQRPPTQRLNQALTMKVAVRGSFDQYWSARPRTLQKNMRRYQNRVSSDDLGQRLVENREPAAVAVAVERYATLEGRGWKGRLGTSLDAGGQLAFYRQVLVAAAQEGRARVFELWLGERLAASRLVLLRENMWVILKTTYDPELAHYAPGRLQLYELLRHAFRHYPGIDVEFYTDADQNQLAWCTSQRWIQHTSHPRNLAVDALLRLRRAAGGGRRQASALAQTALAVEVVQEPGALPPDACKLMEQAEHDTNEAGPAWYQNLAATVFVEPGAMRFYILRCHGDIRAVLPLHVEPVRGGSWRLRALGNFYTSLYQPAFVPGLKPADLLVLLTQVQRDFPRATSWTMSPMDPAGSAYQTLLGALRMLGWLPFEYFAFGNWYQPVTASWDAYLAARPGALRNTLKRLGRKFSAGGGSLQVVTGGAELELAVAAYASVYAASWKRPEPYPEFLPGLLRSCAAQGSLRLGLAWLHGRPVAAQLWIVRYGKAAIYKLAYDEAARAYSPGTLLSAYMMQQVIEGDAVREVDFLHGDDAFKQLWMSQRRERWGIVAYQPRTLGGMLGLLKEAAARTVKQFWRRRAAAPAPAADLWDEARAYKHWDRYASKDNRGGLRALSDD